MLNLYKGQKMVVVVPHTDPHTQLKIGRIGFILEVERLGGNVSVRFDDTVWYFNRELQFCGLEFLGQMIKPSVQHLFEEDV